MKHQPGRTAATSAEHLPAAEAQAEGYRLTAPKSHGLSWCVCARRLLHRLPACLAHAGRSVPASDFPPVNLVPGRLPTERRADGSPRSRRLTCRTISDHVKTCFPRCRVPKELSHERD
jgi:hypothetical protein